MSKYRFTKIIGGNYQNVRLWMIGQTRPGYDNQLKIEKLTDGLVTITAWYDLNQPAKQIKNTKHQPNTTKNYDTTLESKRVCKSRKEVA